MTDAEDSARARHIAALVAAARSERARAIGRMLRRLWRRQLTPAGDTRR